MKIEEPVIRRTAGSFILEIIVDGMAYKIGEMPLIPSIEFKDSSPFAEYIQTDIAIAELFKNRVELCKNIKHYKRGPEFPKRYTKVLVEHFCFDIIKLQKAFDYMGYKQFAESFISHDEIEILTFRELFAEYVEKVDCEYLSKN